MNPAERTQWLAERARALGFDLCGVAPAEALAELEHLPEWLERGYAGEMTYLHDPRRLAPDRALPGARSIIVCGLNYNSPLPYSIEAVTVDAASPGHADGPRGWISRYAWGDDYHEILGKKLNALLAAMRAEFSDAPFEAHAYVDTGPVVERVAAKYAGFGWLAKNTCLINEALGSWLFLGEILTTAELAPTLAPGEPPPDLCGNCRLCLDACPTGALIEPYQLDARRCISYLTIELRGAIPEEFRPAMGRMVFGCDICQDVCPWNRKAATTGLAGFLPRRLSHESETRNSENETRDTRAGTKPYAEGESLYAPPLEWLASLTEEEFRRIFRGSAVRRAKWRGLVRNACVALGNSEIEPTGPAYKRILGLLQRLSGSSDALIAGHARWALERLDGRENNATPPQK